ncbi:GGDEF domain-containing protein [Magnetospirillum sulfuroxidans]|uniref:diguanylate cyclase n=1 Tax=Magnetospirillum sulfuroxidans TaxID=611300 RepID=A0ABS5IBY4_9PROT|nr:GGDEF domain-containing protein [Magnetospirillum sulfuroxidans]MBR9971934.1 GGDEF domain-containing protein [Magnetospirillum sulfuroxidans]
MIRPSLATHSHALRIDLESVMESVVRITEQRTRENLEQCLVTTLLELTNLHRVAILHPLMRGDGLHVEFLAAAEQGKGLLPERESALLEQDHLVAESWALAEETRQAGADGLVRMCLPIASQRDEISAFLCIDTSTDPAPVLGLVRGFAAIYRNFLGILREAERDTLTGLKNRKTFDEKIGRIIAHSHTLAQLVPQERRQHEAGEQHWLGMLDIDHFKRVNDTFGHVFGDEVLLLFAAMMRKIFRSDDLLFRFGGEEFVVVLAPTTADHARQAFERFRAMVEAFAFPQVGQVTVSIGFVAVKPGDIASAVIGQADEALYWAKRNGRNQIHMYEDLLRDGHLTAHTEEGAIELF